MSVSEKQLQQSRFWRKYLRLSRAGVPILRAFEIMSEEEPDAAFAEVLAALLGHLRDGVSLSDALQRFPKVFALSSVELVRTAERRGAWDEILQELSEGLADGTFP